jgi:catechol 2,3-dioxygenase-like lactoylglutathione lyase family enzyme
VIAIWVGVVHTGLTVSDLDRSIAWYTEVLGLELVRRQRNDNAYTRTIVGMPDADLDIAFLRLPGVDPAPSTHILELIQYLQPPGRHPVLRTSDVGTGHLALAVDDIQDTYARLREAGTEFRNAPVEITAGANAGSWACYLLDPDGFTIELMQFAAPGADPAPGPAT